MALPDARGAHDWSGRTVVDRAGATIGTCVQIWTDDATGLPEWAGARNGALTVVVPLLDAAERDGLVHVAVSRDEAVLAPAVRDARHIDEAEEEQLYRHYGIAFSRSASRTLLPAGEGVPAARPGGTTSERAPERAPERFSERFSERPSHPVAGATVVAFLVAAAAAALAAGAAATAVRRRRSRGAVPA